MYVSFIGPQFLQMKIWTFIVCYVPHFCDYKGIGKWRKLVCGPKDHRRDIGNHCLAWNWHLMSLFPLDFFFLLNSLLSEFYFIFLWTSGACLLDFQALFSSTVNMGSFMEWSPCPFWTRKSAQAGLFHSSHSQEDAKSGQGFSDLLPLLVLRRIFKISMPVPKPTALNQSYHSEGRLIYQKFL